MCEYRWSTDYAIYRVFFSLLGWFFIIGFPGAGLWLSAMNTPREGPIGAGVVALILVATTLHSRKYWLRFLDRSVQVALRPDGIWARQLKGTIAWGEILSLSGLEKSVSKDLAVILIRTPGGEIRLDLTGLDAPMITIFKEIEARCKGAV
jgi:hypothetical protein